MPSARKSAPPKPKAQGKRTAVPHGPSEGKGKPAASKPSSKVKTAPAKKSATRTPRGGAAASKPARVAQSVEQRARNSLAAGSIPAPGSNPTRPTAELTPLQERFVLEYIKDDNARRAYLAANPGVKLTTAGTEGHNLLKKPEVLAAIAAQREHTAARIELTAERVMLETARIAFFDPRRLFGPDGEPIPVTGLDDHAAAAVAGLEVLEQYEGSGDERHLVGHLKKYKIADKNAALERAAKLLGMFEKDNRQKADPLLALLDGMRRSAVPVVATPPADDDEG